MTFEVACRYSRDNCFNRRIPFFLPRESDP